MPARIDYAGQGAPGNANMLGELGDGHGEHRQRILDDSAGVRRVAHAHRTFSLVVVGIIEENCILAVESEDHSPVAIHLHSLMPCEFSFEWMKLPSRKVHIERPRGPVDHLSILDVPGDRIEDGLQSTLCQLATQCSAAM
jgi:hypothetical protein